MHSMELQVIERIQSFLEKFSHVPSFIPVSHILSYTEKKCINEVMINTPLLSKQYFNGSHCAE